MSLCVPIPWVRLPTFKTALNVGWSLDQILKEKAHVLQSAHVGAGSRSAGGGRHRIGYLWRAISRASAGTGLHCQQRSGDRGTGSPENGGGWLEQRADYA